jgi:hypothetical protein
MNLKNSFYVLLCAKKFVSSRKATLNGIKGEVLVDSHANGTVFATISFNQNESLKFHIID